MRKICFSAAVLVLTNSLSAYAAGPLQHVDIGNWHGGSYTFDKTGQFGKAGQFSHCAISASYASGILFIVSVNRNYGWQLGFVNNGWQLNEGENIPIDLTFDGRGPIHIYANVLQPNFVAVNMPTTSDIIKYFRKASLMTAFARGQVYSFVLTDTTRSSQH